jgi:hypothetical protein
VNKKFQILPSPLPHNIELRAENQMLQISFKEKNFSVFTSSGGSFLVDAICISIFSLKHINLRTSEKAENI